MRYALDTSFVVDYLRGLPETHRWMTAMYERGDEPLVTSVVVAEIWSGAGDAPNPPIDRFLRYIEYVHPGPDAARLAGQWRAAARKRGRTLGVADALIAASAAALDAAVLTRNVRDFAQTPVRIETY